MSLLGLLVLQGALWGLSYILREDEPDEVDNDKKSTKHMGTVKAGAAAPIVFGRCLVTANPSMIYSKSHGGDDGEVHPIYIEGQFPIALIPNSCISNFTFGHYYFGGLIVHRRISPASFSDNDDPKPFTFASPDLWGGPGHGGGVGGPPISVYPMSFQNVGINGWFDPSIFNPGWRQGFIAPQLVYEVIDNSVHRTRVDATDDKRAATLRRVMAQNKPPETYEDLATIIVGPGGYTNLAYLIIEHLVVGEGKFISNGETRQIPSIEVEAICRPDYPFMEYEVDGFVPSKETARALQRYPEFHANDGDANPAAVLYCLLVDSVVGLSIPSINIDYASFQAAASTLRTEENGFSMAVTKPTGAEKLIKEVLKQVDGVLYSDPVTRKLTMKLIRQDYGAFPYASVVTADVSNCVQVVDYKVSAPEDLFNQVKVKFKNRAKHYADDSAMSQDSASVNEGRPAQIIEYTYNGVKTAVLANTIAARELSRVGTPTISMTLQLSREFATHTPGDVILWSWPAYGITNMVLRILQINYGTWEDNKITATCVKEKGALAQPSFEDPGGYTVDRPPAVDYPSSTDFYDFSNTSALGGFDLDGDLWNGRMALLVSASDTASSALLEWSRDNGLSYNTVAVDLPLTPTGRLAANYNSVKAESYDTTIGITMIRTRGEFPLGPFTEAQIAHGDNLIKIDDEVMSFESATDLGNNSYVLNNIWRGLLDTTATDHTESASVTSLSGVSQSKSMTAVRPGADGKVLFRVRMRTLGTVQPVEDATYLQATFKSRGKSPTAPENIVISAMSRDDDSTGPEVDYSFDLNDNTAVTFRVLAGNLGGTIVEGGLVVANDARGTWARRESVPTAIVRGDAADVEPASEAVIRYNLEHRRVGELEWGVAQSATYGNGYKGSSEITKAEEFLSFKKLLPGPNEVRVCAVQKDPHNGADRCSIDAQSQIVDVIVPRQLLANGTLAPYWDINAASTGEAYGEGLKVLGNATESARGWEVSGDLPITFGVPVNTLSQGSSGFAYWGGRSSASLQYGIIQQIVPIPLSSDDAINKGTSKATLTFFYYRDATEFDDYYAVTIECLDESGAVVSTIGGTPIAGTSTTGWSKIETSLVVDEPATAIRVIIALRNDSKGGIQNAISDVQLNFAPEISAQLIVQNTFLGGFASWTTTGTWVNTSSALGISKLSVDAGDMAYCTTPSVGICKLTQDVTLPVEYNSGDWARVQFWTARLNTNSTNTFELTISCKNTGATITSKTIGPFTIPQEDQWYPYEIWLRVEELTTDIGVSFTMDNVSGGGTIDIALDGLQMHLYKADQRPITLSYDTPVSQPVPSTPQEFSQACNNPEIYPTRMFLFNDLPNQDIVDTSGTLSFDEVIGVDEVDVARGISTTAPWNGATFSGDCLELTSAMGGVRCSDYSFLDPDNKSIAIYFRYKMSDFGQSGKSNILSKIHRNPTPSDGAGFQIYFDATTTKMYMYVASNKFEAGTFSSTVELDLQALDNDTHWVCFKIDLEGAVMSCFGDIGMGSSADINPLLALDFSNAEDKAVIGYNDSLYGSFDAGFAAPFQMSMLAVLKGPSVRKFTKAAADKMWFRGVDPNTGFELNYNRTGELILPVSDTEVCAFTGTGSSALAAPPISYWDFLMTGNKLALSCPETTSNLLAYAEDFSNAAWTKTNVTIHATRRQSPLGLLTAQEINQGPVVGGYVQRVVTTAVNTHYTFSLYLESVASPKVKSDLDFRKLVKNNFFGSPSALEQDFWDMQTLLGNKDYKNSANTSYGAGTATLSNVGGLVSQTAYGVSNGIDLSSYNCWEASTISDYLIASDVTAGDSNLEDFALRVTLRLGNAPTGVSSIVGKLESATTPGWLLYMTNSSLRFFIRDNDGITIDSIIGSVQAEISDGAVHTISVFYHYNTTTLYIKGDTFAQVSFDVSALTDSITNTQALRIGSSHVDTVPNLQVLSFGFTKAATSNDYYTEAPVMPGQDPTGSLITISRATTISVQVDATGNICHYGQHMVTIGKSSEITDVGYALAVNDAVTNLVSDSEDFSTWTALNCIPVGRSVDSPDGFRNMTKLEVSSALGYIEHAMTTVSATLYTISIYIRDADTGSTTGKLVLYDTIGDSVISTQTFTTTSALQRISLTATTLSVGSALRVELDVIDTNVHIWGAQCELGGYATFYVRSIGASATSVRSHYRANFQTDREFGQIRSVSNKVAVRGNVALWNCASSSGNENRIRLIANSVNNTVNSYDGVGGSETSVIRAHANTLAEEIFVYTWDQSAAGDNTGGYEAILNYQGVDYLAAASPWEGSVGVGADVINLDIGSISGSFVQPGFYQRITSYRGVDEDPSPSETTHTVQIELLRSDLSTVLATLTKPAVDGWSRVSIDAQALDTSVAVRIYGGTSATSKTSCRAWGLMVHNNESASGYPIVLNPGATTNVSPTLSQSRQSTDVNFLCNADEGRIQALLALPIRTSGGVQRPIVMMSSVAETETDRRYLYGTNAVANGTTVIPSFATYDNSETLSNTYDSAISIAEGTETLIDVSWRSKVEQRVSGEFAEFLIDGVTAAIGVTTVEETSDGLVYLEVGSNVVDGEHFDGGVQKLTLYGNGTPVITPPSAPVAVRVWPESVGSFIKTFKLTPAMLSTMQNTSDLIPDLVSTGNFVAADTPVFGSPAENGRVGVLFDSVLDKIELVDPDHLNPDGVSDYTFIIRAFLPNFSGGGAIFNKRGNSSGFPGCSVYMDASGLLKCVQDGGDVGREDITIATHNHQNQYVDIAYVIDRTGLNEGRLESTLGTGIDTLSTIPSLGGNTPLAIGRSQYEGRSTMTGLLVTYFVVIKKAMTRVELLEYWVTRIP